jgi:hypothetical protein
MAMKTILTAAVLMVSFSSFAQELFVMKKSLNPRNVLHFKANVENCKFKHPAITNYWVMGETDGHIEGLAENEKAYFQPKVTYQKEKELDFTMGAIERMGSKLEDNSIRVRLVNCKPKAYIDIKHQELQLTELYVSVNLFMSVKYMNITGIAPNGSKITHRIE